MSDVEKDRELRAEIRVEAYFLSTRKPSYNDLCYYFAENQLILQREGEKPSSEMIQRKAEEIFNEYASWDELCWVVAESTVKVKRTYPQYH